MRRLLPVLGLLAALPALLGLGASASQLAVTPSSLTATMVAPVTPPSVVSFALTNGGAVAGQADTGDRLIVTFSRALDASTLCSSWVPAPSSTQSITTNGTVTVTVADGGAGNDVLSVSTSTCTFNLGVVDLGSAAFTANGPLTFSGNGTGGRSTISYDPATFQVTVVLGTRGGTGTAATVASVTATFTASSSVRYGDGTSVAPATATKTGVQL